MSSVHQRLTSRTAQVLVVSKEGQNQAQATKSRHGVTPPMRDARKRMFQKPHNVDSATMRQLEEDLLTLAQVRDAFNRISDIRWHSLAPSDNSHV